MIKFSMPLFQKDFNNLVYCQFFNADPRAHSRGAADLAEPFVLQFRRGRGAPGHGKNQDGRRRLHGRVRHARRRTGPCLDDVESSAADCGLPETKE